MIITSALRGLLRDCETDCGTDGALHSTSKICPFQEHDPLMRRLERCHAVPVAQLLHAPGNGTSLYTGAGHVSHVPAATNTLPIVVPHPAARRGGLRRWCVSWYRRGALVTLLE